MRIGISGWSQYYTSAVSSRIFDSLDSIMFNRLWKWTVHRHPTKETFWVKSKYFRRYFNDNWRFMTSNKINLVKYGDHAIKRHIKVIGAKSPYNGDWVYWSNRLSKTTGISPRVMRLLKIQQNKCSHCKLYFRSDDIVEIHHQDRNKNNNNVKNLCLLHGHCHDYLHKKKYV